MKKNNNVTNATIAVTYRCNAKCIMCNIWKDDTKDTLTLEDFAKLPKTLEDVNLTGGEPFLRKDIVDVVGVLTKLNPNVRPIFSSNGFLSEHIVESMKKIRKINNKTGIGLSIDGMQEIHAEVRGIPNAFDKVMNTIDGLKKAGINDIRLAFTASDKNVKELLKVYKLAKELNVEFTMSIVHNSENYFNIDTNILTDLDSLNTQVQEIISDELSSNNPRRLMRTYYLKGILEYAKSSKRLLPCYALNNSFFMDAKGDIYPCNMLETAVGNIKEQDFDEIWNSNKTEKLKNWCFSCNQCWMVCTVKNSIIKHPFIAGKEVLLDKLNKMLK